MDSVTLLWLTLAIPTLGAVGIVLTGRRPNLREGVTLTAAVLLWGTVMHLLARVAGDVIGCIDTADANAMNATFARLLRIGEQSLTAIWDLQDITI